MLTKQQVQMVKLALATGGTPVADRKWMSDGFVAWPTPDTYALYYNVGHDTKVMVRDVIYWQGDE